MSENKPTTNSTQSQQPTTTPPATPTTKQDVSLPEVIVGAITVGLGLLGIKVLIDKSKTNKPKKS